MELNSFFGQVQCRLFYFWQGGLIAPNAGNGSLYLFSKRSISFRFVGFLSNDLVLPLFF